MIQRVVSIVVGVDDDAREYKHSKANVRVIANTNIKTKRSAYATIETKYLLGVVGCNLGNHFR